MKAYPDKVPWRDWAPSGEPYTSRTKARETVKTLRLIYPCHKYKLVAYDRRGR
jgi:hypothetical protein